MSSTHGYFAMIRVKKSSAPPCCCGFSVAFSAVSDQSIEAYISVYCLASSGVKSISTAKTAAATSRGKWFRVINSFKCAYPNNIFCNPSKNVFGFFLRYSSETCRFFSSCSRDGVSIPYFKTFKIIGCRLIEWWKTA